MDAIRIVTAATPGTGPGGTPGSGPGGAGGSGGAGYISGYSPGYTELASDGGIFNFGTQFFGSMGGQKLNAPMVAGAQVSGQPGYWTVASDGGVFSFGGAGFYGSTGGQSTGAPIVRMASTPVVAGTGWLLRRWVFNYGDAAFYGGRQTPQQTRCGHGGDPRRRGRPVGGVRPRGLQLRRGRLLRFGWWLSAQQTGCGNRSNPRRRATRSLPPTAASATATRPSTVRREAHQVHTTEVVSDLAPKGLFARVGGERTGTERDTFTTHPELSICAWRSEVARRSWLETNETRCWPCCSTMRSVREEGQWNGRGRGQAVSGGQRRASVARQAPGVLHLGSFTASPVRTR